MSFFMTTFFFFFSYGFIVCLVWGGDRIKLVFYREKEQVASKEFCCAYFLDHLAAGWDPNQSHPHPFTSSFSCHLKNILEFLLSRTACVSPCEVDSLWSRTELIAQSVEAMWRKVAYVMEQASFISFLWRDWSHIWHRHWQKLGRGLQE